LERIKKEKMRLDKFEIEGLKEEIAKILAKRIYLPELQKEIAHKLVDEFVTKLDNEKFMQECIEKYKRSVGHRLGQQADRDLFYFITSFGERLQRVELKIAEKGELKP